MEIFTIKVVIPNNSKTGEFKRNKTYPKKAE